MTDTILLVHDDDVPERRRVPGTHGVCGHPRGLGRRSAGGGRRSADVVLLDLSSPTPGLTLERPEPGLRGADGPAATPTAVRASSSAPKFLTKPVDVPHLMVAVSRAAERSASGASRRLHGTEGATLTVRGGVAPMKASSASSR
jgi:hypothetical protein